MSLEDMSGVVHQIQEHKAPESWTLAISQPQQSQPTVVNIYHSTRELEQQLATGILNLAALAIRERGSFTIAFTGGKLPKLLGSAFSSLPAQEIEELHRSISSWIMFLADERLVPLTSNDSNYYLIKQHFLSSLEGRFLPSLLFHIDEHFMDKPSEAATEYDNKIKSRIQDECFDLLLLGMGEDGHCCSLPPQHSSLRETAATVIAITDFPAKPHHRITFSLPLIHKARKVLFVVTGEDTADTVKTVLQQPEKGLPSSLAWGQETEWWLDKDAASKLDRPQSRSSTIHIA